MTFSLKGWKRDGSRWLVIVDEGSKKGIRNAIRRVKRGAIRFEKVKNRIMNGIFRSAKTLWRFSLLNRIKLWKLSGTFFEENQKHFEFGPGIKQIIPPIFCCSCVSSAFNFVRIQNCLNGNLYGFTLILALSNSITFNLISISSTFFSCFCFCLFVC